AGPSGIARKVAGFSLVVLTGLVIAVVFAFFTDLSEKWLGSLVLCHVGWASLSALISSNFVGLDFTLWGSYCRLVREDLQKSREAFSRRKEELEELVLHDPGLSAASD